MADWYDIVTKAQETAKMLRDLSAMEAGFYTDDLDDRDLDLLFIGAANGISAMLIEMNHAGIVQFPDGWVDRLTAPLVAQDQVDDEDEAGV